VFHRESSAFAEVQEYTFKHAVLREVAYESVLKRIRRSYHAQVAEWLIETCGERVGEFAGLIGEHLERAERHARALEFMKQAAQSAAARYANAEAADYYTRALALLPAGDRQGRWELLLGREQVLDLLGRRAAQRQDLDELERLAAELNAPSYQARVALNRAKYYTAVSDFTEKLAADQAALAFARQAADPLLEAEARMGWGNSLWRLDRSQEGIEQAEAALALVQALAGPPARRLEADILGLLAALSDSSGQQQFYKYLEDGLRLCQETGDRRREARFLYLISYGAYEVSDYDRARAYLEQALRAYREIGDRGAEHGPLLHLGNVYKSLGDLARAIAYYEQALHSARDTGFLLGEGRALSAMGATVWLQGDYGRALALLEESLERQNRAGEPRWRRCSWTAP
jgi:tetratricopeptide (TPR) repeat protein